MTRLRKLKIKLTLRNAWRKAASSLEYWAVVALGKVLGLNAVVRYLRNPDPAVTVPLLRAFGATIGAGTTFKRSLFIDNAYEDLDSAGDFSHIVIGENCFVGDCVYFDLANRIVFEDNVVISGHVGFVTHADCNRSEYLATLFPRKSLPIKIEKGAWIGLGAKVLPGVTVGRNSVVAAGSLLRSDAGPNSLYAGLPAVKIKALE